MSQHRKNHIAYFESDAGLELIQSLTAGKQQEHDAAEKATDMQASFAHTQRAQGLQQALDVIMSMTSGGKKP